MTMRTVGTLMLVVCAACGGAAPEGTVEAPVQGAGDVRTRPSEMLDRLRAAGFDPANLPSLDDIDDEQLQNGMMPLFARSLGVKCSHCHEGDNYETPTINRHIAEEMYEHFVRKLRMADGSPIFCDSCHTGEATFLVREPRTKVMAFMRDNYVRPLSRADGQEHGCDTCHGEPPNWKFLPQTPH